MILKSELKWMSKHQIKISSILVSCFILPSIKELKEFRVLEKSHDVSFQNLYLKKFSSGFKRSEKDLPVRRSGQVSQ